MEDVLKLTKLLRDNEQKFEKVLQKGSLCCIITITKYLFKFIQEVSTMEVLKVSSHSSPNSVAGAIAGVIREKSAVEVQAIGAGAANQSIKAIAIARGYLAPIGIDLICTPLLLTLKLMAKKEQLLSLFVNKDSLLLNQ